ncbi:rab-interacting lysosomal protein [Osmerus eperlanus]|uniref:rab-interacting lysosomal protein n=1 Tax=Osmerus eperlanus TaxID=29151 RepID=UPI002E118A2F
MESSCERNELTDDKNKEGCFERTCLTLTVDDVYEIAKLIGSEVEKLIDGYGKESALGLVPKIVKVLELLESYALRNNSLKSKEEELYKAFETLQVQQQKKRVLKENEDCNKNEIREVRQEEEQWRRRCEELQAQVLQLQGDNQELQSHLKGNHAQEDRVQRQEREVMLKLKEVVDKQRDELRAKQQEITSVSKEVEALQEQLERFMKMNSELRHKQTIVQAQVKSAVERKADMEADLREKQKEIERLSSQLEKAHSLSAAGTGSPSTTQLDLTDKMIIDMKDPNRPCFTKQEVREILSERNELKANLFLVQEELAYYQREILNDERCPGFLLDAMRSAIKKQRTVIKAKMLGVPVDDCSSDEEDKGPLFERGEARTETDGAEEKPAESRIRNLFGFLTRSGSSRSPSHQTATSSSWEIIVPEDAETEPRQSP